MRVNLQVSSFFRRGVATTVLIKCIWPAGYRGGLGAAQVSEEKLHSLPWKFILEAFESLENSFFEGFCNSGRAGGHHIVASGATSAAQFNRGTSLRRAFDEPPAAQ